ncbi:MAG: histidinol-phosphatase [Bacteroidota bacterium]
MWTNYHCHTNFCDGKKPVADVVAHAKSIGMIAIGLSSHAPLPFDNKWSMRPGMLDSYLSEIERARAENDIQVYAGLEVDYIPGKISPFDFKDRLDYTVGSVHFVDNNWEIDNTYDVFFEGLKANFDGSIRRAVARYFELTREMVKTTPPTIVGHIDKIKMHNRGDCFFMEDEPWYREQIDLTLDAVAKAGCIVEVNTRGLYQNKVDTTYPSPWILLEILRKNIPITLSSDAHHPDDLVNLFPETARDLIHIGFKKIRILLDGKWKDVAFGEHGISGKDYAMA